MGPQEAPWMVTDLQVRRLRKLMSKGYTLSNSAAKASIDEKTARKYSERGEAAQ